MKARSSKILVAAFISLVAFLLWTAAICTVDVRPIGPEASTVGFAALNGMFHSLTGTHMLLYTVTDWLGLVPIGVCLCFAAFGLVQLLRRRSLLRVDGDILLLGGFYVIVFAAYILFEMFAVNHRPVLIGGKLEASYPSSTTLMTLCVMPTAVLQIKRRMKRSAWRKTLCIAAWAFTAFMVVGRLISGVHWLTDIVGSVLLSGGLVLLYAAFSGGSLAERE